MRKTIPEEQHPGGSGNGGLKRSKSICLDLFSLAVNDTATRSTDHSGRKSLFLHACLSSTCFERRGERKRYRVVSRSTTRVHEVDEDETVDMSAPFHQATKALEKMDLDRFSLYHFDLVEELESYALSLSLVGTSKVVPILRKPPLTITPSARRRKCNYYNTMVSDSADTICNTSCKSGQYVSDNVMWC